MEHLAFHSFGTRHVQVVNFRQSIEATEREPLTPQQRFLRERNLLRALSQELGTSMHLDAHGILIVRGRFIEPVLRKAIKLAFAQLTDN